MGSLILVVFLYENSPWAEELHNSTLIDYRLVLLIESYKMGVTVT